MLHLLIYSFHEGHGGRKEDKEKRIGGKEEGVMKGNVSEIYGNGCGVMFSAR